MERAPAVVFFSTLTIALSSQCVFSQNPFLRVPAAPSVLDEADEAAGRPFYQNMLEGAKASFRAWEIPLLVTSVFTERQKAGNGLELPPLRLDENIASDFADNAGSKALGSISPKYYPRLAAQARFAGMVAIDILNVQDYSPRSYTKMFRFQQALYYNTVVTHLAKRNFNRHRPDRSDTQSFFSGHTSTAFATSTFLYLEARDFINGQARLHEQQLPLFSPTTWKVVSFSALYGWAAYVGYSRIHDGKHYLSDVIVGAASGTLISYLLYPHEDRSHKTTRIKLGVVPMRETSGLALSVNF
jgi:membrane-associated phospholipid phosphatase